MYRHVFILILSVFLFSTYCTRKPDEPERAAEQEKSAETEKKPLSAVLEQATVELTEREKCLIALHHERGMEGDKCIVDCMLTGDARTIGGGCYHVCIAFPGREYEDLPETAKCYEDSS